MTAGAREFVPQRLSRHSPAARCAANFGRRAEAAMSHIELARWAELLLVAPPPQVSSRISRTEWR